MDKYAKIKNIGEGAFGKALLVRDKKNSHQYVVKEIPIHKMKAREREDARKEVSVLAQMHHPYIVTYRESFEEKGYLHIVMDFCEKGDLYHKISSQRGILFPEDQVMDWFVQIALAIKYVHDRKILHRDIKTQNIFLTANGTVQLGDFGIAKVLGSTVELARTCIGTPYYLSPEICENRPYNNKSDIWSLGCVLYEMTTLKHAFEAGNMKNLVLKIIRGSYPPISPKYSYDLRGLIAKLFKRTPRDRPSVNSVLKMPFVQRKVPKFLTDEQIADEFSHTIMHGQKLGHKQKPPSPGNRTPAPGQRPPSAAARRPLPPKPTPAAAPRKYNPANIYGAPVARKSNERSQDKKRPGSNSGSRPGSAQDLQRKKQEFIEKERKRREEANKAAIEKKHKDLMEKQKINRINKAREDGWKNMVGSLGSDDSGKSNDNNKGNQGQIKWPAPKPAEPQQQPNNRGDYADYHAYLDKLDRDRQGRQNAPAGGAAYMAAPRQAAVPRAGVTPRVPAATPMAQQQAEEFRQKGNDAAERARIVNEFIQRKKEAEANKRRGHAEMFGGAAPWEPARNIPSPSPARDDSRPSSARDDGRPSSADARRRDEEEYLERLKKIRQANYMDRKNDKYSEAEMRKKKIEALRQQADDKAKQLREQLEQQRREMIDKENKVRGNQIQRYAQGRDRPGSAPSARPMPKPVPAVGITGVLHAIGSEPPHPEPLKTPPGIGMTGALQAIWAKEDSPEERPKSALQVKKDEILKGVNQRGPPRAGWGAPPDKLDLEIKEEEEPESSRSRWGEKLDDRLKDLPLAETASAMEVTSARDKVIVNPSDVAASRQQWGRPGSTIVKALKECPIMEAGSTMSSDKSDDSVPSSVVSIESKPGVGSTITVSSTEGKPGTTITLPKPSVQTGTITIASTEKKENITRPEIEPQKAADSESSEKSASQSKSESSMTSEPGSSKSEDNKVPEKSSSEGQLSKPPVASKPVINKPPLPAKPATTEKPLVLPKPTLLVKPESPMTFGNQVPPKAVNIEGEGSLFSKVELDPEEQSDSLQQEKVKVDEIKDDKLKVEEVKDDNPKERGDILKDKNNKPLSGVAVALTTGHFDMKNTGLLRTCSEPDLTKLNKDEVIKEERRSLDLQRNKEDSDEDENTEVTVDIDNKKNDESDKSVDDQDDDDVIEDEDDEDYEDLMSVRETMESLLLRECSTDDENKNTGKFRLSAASNSKEDDIEEENDEKTNNSGDENADNDDENKDEDGDNEDENGDDNENVVNNYAEALEEDEDDEEYKDDSALFQSDESDADTQFGDDEDNYDLFSRLEESREELENQLGCDKFLKVYKAVQALQEDEDESIEDGARLAMNMLGKEHEHLYPKIFQLVMADAAFTEEQKMKQEEKQKYSYNS